MNRNFLSELRDTPFALLVWYIQKEKEKEEAKVYSCLATWNVETGTVDIRRNKNGKMILTLDGFMIDRINVVTEDMKDLLLGCDYGISLTMSDIEGDHTDDLLMTGMKWD